MLLIGRALLTKPRLVLVDEISEGLQPAMVTRLREVLTQERRARGLAIVLVEQNVDFALALADRYAVLKVEQSWRPDALPMPGRESGSSDTSSSSALEQQEARTASSTGGRPRRKESVTCESGGRITERDHWRPCSWC